jgi:hypothetical protein
VGALVDLDHPLGKNCQAAVLFNDGHDGQTAKVAGPFSNTFLDSPQVLYAQTWPRQPLFVGATPPTWIVGTAGLGINCANTDAGFYVGLIASRDSYDLDYPDTAISSTVTHGETVLIIRRKTDTSARTSTLFGVEMGGIVPDSARCGAHVPYSDGTVYWDYGGASGSNRLTVSSLTFSTNVEKWIFTAGSQGMTIWRDGLKLASSSTAVTRVVPNQTLDYTAWCLNRGNGSSFGVDIHGDLQDFYFAMFIARQWSDLECEWWFAEPYAAFLYPAPLDFSEHQFGPAGGAVFDPSTGFPWFQLPGRPARRWIAIPYGDR